MIPEKVAVLGGGIAGLTAAMELTDPAQRGRYAVTVYQAGWVLGGKGASVRNRADHDRIEEHGLHLWLGFYENAFALMRAAYAEAARPASCPIRTVEDGFVKASDIVLQERTERGWESWVVRTPEDDRVPGATGDLPSPYAYVRLGVNLVLSFLVQWADTAAGRTERAGLQAVVHGLRGWLAVAATAGGLAATLWTRRGARTTADLAEAYTPRALQRLVTLLRQGLARGWKAVGARIADDALARRMWICSEFASVLLIGMIRDGLVVDEPDYAALDDEEWRAWMRRHGGSELMVGSSLIDAFYNLAFARPDGAAAGMAIVGSLRFFLAYRGAILWRMTAGMGEVVFAPIYEVLHARGVRFAFFHQVEHLAVDAAGAGVARIDLAVQARVKAGTFGYEPLFLLDGLPCWPEAPLYDQLEDDPEVKALDWAAPMAPTPPVSRLSLHRGEDFDHLVLAIPVGAHPYIARELMDARPAFRAMVEGVRTIKTLNLQLWMNPALSQLGWPTPLPILGSFAEPWETWSDMTHLLPREHFGGEVGSLAYLCGVLDSGATPILPEDPAIDLARAREESHRWLWEDAAALWPAARRDGDFNWDTLFDPVGRDGAARLDAAYLRVNTDPSERYVLPVVGTTKYRLFPEESGFDNVVLAGDWTRTGLDGGCIEASVMSGRMAARGISGLPAKVIGEAPRKTPPQRAALPRYVERGADNTQRPPYLLTGCRLTALPLEADRGALQALIDRSLNVPAAGAVRYVVAAPIVMLVGAFSARACSLDPDHARRGWTPEADVAFWVPCVRRGGGPGLVWHLAYVWVDGLAALLSGREVYGFPKSAGEMEVEHGERGLESLRMRAAVLPQYAPETTPEVRELLAVTRHEGGVGGELPGPLASWLTGLGGNATLVFLKQVRDAADAERACYQAVVEARATTRALRGSGVVGGRYSVELSRFDSHPFVRELGLRDRYERVVGVWVDFDFVMEAGRVIR